MARRPNATDAQTSSFGFEPPEVVKQVQTFLNAQGYQPALVVDGDIGPKTNAAVLWWQQSHGLMADGIIGPQTLGSMKLAPSPTPAKLQTVSGPSIPGLRQAVVNAFPDFSGKFEGKALPYMYADSKGYITTGTGNKIDPINQALILPWKRPDGSLASQQEIADAWNTVKSAYPGVQSTASQSLTNLRLDADGLDRLLFGTLASFNDYLKAHVPNYTQAPADAQMGHNSLAWAYGPGVYGVLGSYGPQLLSAFANNDYATAAALLDPATAHEQSINPGIVPRIAATKQLFLNADAAIKKKANLDSLYFPGAVIATAISIWTWVTGFVVAGAATVLGYEYYKGRV